MVHVDRLYAEDKNVLHDDYEQIPVEKRKTSITNSLMLEFVFTFLC